MTTPGDVAHSPECHGDGDNSFPGTGFGDDASDNGGFLLQCHEIGSPCFMPDPGECASSPSAAVGASDSKFSTCRDLGEQPVLTETQHDALFSRCLLTNCDFVGIKMPWEEGIYKEIFSSEPLPQFPVPQMEISGFCSLELGMEPQTVVSRVAEVASSTDANPVFKPCVSCTDGEFYDERRSNLREAAIGKFLIVLRHCLLGSATGRHIIALGNEEQQSMGARDIVDAVLGVKSPSTLIKRANSLLSYLRWLARSGLQL